MRYVPVVLGVSVLSVAGVFAAGLLDCAPPDEDPTVLDESMCEATKLAAAPAPEGTVKLYLDMSTDLLARAHDLETRFQASCNKIGMTLGLPAGADIQAACGPITARLAKLQLQAPKPDGGVKLPWVRIRWSQECAPDSQVEAKCVADCSGGAACDPTAACPPGSLTGTCAGNCTGTCERSGAALPCTGACVGACNMPDASTNDAGLASCEGECIGACAGKTWTGRCAGACNAGFFGQCLGTCTGSCDGVPIGSVPEAGVPEAGMPEAGAEGGAPEGGVVDAGIRPAPTGNDGNCPGLCAGQCSSQGSGNCATQCKAPYLGGKCTGGGSCTGSCNSSQTACLDTCTGTCTTNPNGGACDGVCVGTCDVPLTATTCRREIACESMNAECKLICGVRGALAAKCPLPPTPEVLIVDDGALYDAVRANMAEFAQIINEMDLVLASASSVADRTVGDYKAVGVVTTRGYACVQQANKTVTEALASLNKSKFVADSLNPQTVAK
jgi:hypothetical protein